MKKNIVFYLLFFAFLALPSRVLALGQMTQPIIINDALRGEEIQQEITTINSDSFDTPIKFTSEGDIEGWVRFFNDLDFTEEIGTTTIKSQEVLKVYALIKIPDDIANGEYKGAISVSNVAVEDEDKIEEQSNAAVFQKIDREVAITVSDKEIVDIGKSSVIPNKYDLKADEALNIRIIYDNQGNFSLAPQVRVKIKKDNENVHDLIYPYPDGEAMLTPKSQHEIEEITVQTVDWKKGKYLAELTFYDGAEIIHEKSFSFSINDKSDFPIWWVFGISNTLWWLIPLVILSIFYGLWQSRKKITKIKKYPLPRTYKIAKTKKRPLRSYKIAKAKKRPLARPYKI